MEDLNDFELLMRTLASLATVLGVFFAFFTYFKNEHSKIKDAAKLVLNEIRSAESVMRKAKEDGHVYPFKSKVFSTNSWTKNIHLFAGKMKNEDIDAISRFYQAGETIDEIVRTHLGLEINSENIFDLEKMPEDPKNPGQENFKHIPSGATKKDLSRSNQIITIISSQIEFIFHETSTDKLKELAENKFLKVFN